MSGSQAPGTEPVDPDVGGTPAAGGPLRGGVPVVAAVAAGGVLGALARYGAGVAWPTRPAAFPWTTFVINVLGCALIGVLLVLVTDVWSGRRLVRPFLGTGLLGGFTTFSTYAVDGQRLLADGHLGIGSGYLVGTLVAALLAVTAAARLTRAAVSAVAR